MHFGGLKIPRRFLGCSGRGLFSKKASGVKKPAAGSELPHRLRPVVMSGGAAVHRLSALATAENAVPGVVKAVSRAGQRVALGDVTNLVVRDGGRLAAADSAPDVVWLVALIRAESIMPRLGCQ